MLQVINSGRAGAEKNMGLDAFFLEHLDPNGVPILHLYEWERASLTYGHFIEPSQFLDLTAVERLHLDLARRPTGGGIVFHIWDFAFSFLMPKKHPRFSLNTLDNYRFVNEAVLDAVLELFPNNQGNLRPLDKSASSGKTIHFSENDHLCNGLNLIVDPFPLKEADCAHFCMARPTQYDVVYQGRKVAGAAQRKRKQGYLHQGTISLATPNVSLLKEVLLSKTDVIEAMLAHSFAFSISLEKSRERLQKLLTEKLQDKLSLRDYEPSSSEKG